MVSPSDPRGCSPLCELPSSSRQAFVPSTPAHQGILDHVCMHRDCLTRSARSCERLPVLRQAPLPRTFQPFVLRSRWSVRHSPCQQACRSHSFRRSDCSCSPQRHVRSRHHAVSRSPPHLERTRAFPRPSCTVLVAPVMHPCFYHLRRHLLVPLLLRDPH